MRKKICIPLVATFLEDRHINELLQIFLREKRGGYTEAISPLHMHATCELNTSKTTLYKDSAKIKHLYVHCIGVSFNSVQETPFAVL